MGKCEPGVMCIPGQLARSCALVKKRPWKLAMQQRARWAHQAGWGVGGNVGRALTSLLGVLPLTSSFAPI